MAAGYRLYRKGETTAAEHDLNSLRLRLKRARAQRAEWLEMAADTGRSEQNRQECNLVAERYERETIPHLQRVIERAAGEMIAR